MKTFTTIFLALSVTAVPFAAFGASPAAPTGFPFTDEDLNYSVNWPSGISLGDAHLHAKHSGANWNFSLTLDAGVPGFAVKDSYRAEAVPDFCSAWFDRSASHGSRAAQEKETIDRERATAARVTKEGGKSEFPVPACVKDALTYLFYSRREMGQGRVPAAQQILLGGLYQIGATYAGAPMISVGGKQMQSDKVTYAFKTANSEFKFDIYFARDPARTPLLISAPLAMGTFSMELTR